MMTDEPNSPPRWIMPALIVGVLAAAALTALLLTGGLPAAPAPAPAPTAVPAAAPAPEAGHGGLNPSGPAVTVISLSEARARFDAGTAIFIDVRSGSEFAAGHIPGALTITSGELETLIREAGPEVVLIAYGDANRPESGQRGAQIFMELGYPTVIALEGGFQRWRDAGHPVQ
ncbi:MAG: rhodanese-like domain-containing protein [Oscillochloridaceae bacterium umkhey_bin13]